MNLQARVKRLELERREEQVPFFLRGGRVEYLSASTVAGLGLDCIWGDAFLQEGCPEERQGGHVWFEPQWWSVAAKVDPERMHGTIYRDFPRVFGWLLKAFPKPARVLLCPKTAQDIMG